MNDVAIKEIFSQFYKDSKSLFPNCGDEHSKLFPRMILSTVANLNLETEQVEEALDGLGSNDFGIDAFVKDIDDNFHIFQFKSKKNLKEKISINNIHSEIDSFSNIITKLKQDAKVTNNRIIEIKEEIMDNPDSEFFLHYYVQEKIEECKIEEYKNANENKNLEIYDICTINELYKEYISKFANQLKELNLPIESISSVGNTKTRYLLILNGFDIYKLMDDKKFQLFKNNVRFYLGDTQAVNKEIIKTIKSEPDRFFSYNNGITIESTNLKIAKNEKSVYLEDPSIINGAQTVNCIYSAYKKLLAEKKEVSLNEKRLKLKEQFNKIKILAKLIIVNSPEEEYSKLLSKYVNSQNNIKEADYFSNLEEQIRLKRELGNYNLFYEIKRGETTYFKSRKNEKEELTNKTFKDFDKNYLRLQDLNRNYIATFHNPSSSFHSNSNLFKKDHNLYETIIKKDLNGDFDITVKKLIFSQFLINAIKEELVNYKNFYSCINTNMSITEKCKLLNETHYKFKDELAKNLSDINIFEEDYGTLNIPLLSKGKYLYSYAIRLFLENLLHIKTQNINGFYELLDSKLLMSYNQFKNKISPLFYITRDIIDPSIWEIINNGKTENQLTMNSTDYLTIIDKLILDKTKEIKRDKKTDFYFKI